MQCKLYGSNRVPISKVQANTVLDPYRLPSPFFLSPGTLSQECFHSQACKKRQSCRGQCVCVCIFVCICVCLHACLCAYFSVCMSVCQNGGQEWKRFCVSLRVCVCVCCYWSGFSSIIGLIGDGSRPGTLLHITHCLHTLAFSFCLFPPPSNSR